MNEPENQYTERPDPASTDAASQPERKASTVVPHPPENQSHDVAPAQQPESKPDGSAEHSPAFELVKPDRLVDGALPEPSDHVIREHVPHATKPEAPKPDNRDEKGAMPDGLEKTGRGLRDNSGRYFDPEKHQHSNGIPKTSEKGYFRPWGRIHKKAGLHLKPEGFASQMADDEDKPEPRESFIDKAKRAIFGEREGHTEPEPKKEPESREPASGQPSQHPQFANGGLIGLPQPSETPGGAKDSGKETEAATAAAQLVAMEEMIAVMVFSEEWQFLSEERKGLVMAWTRAFEEKGIVETPWWMELGAAHAVIIANRADKPKTREKLGKMKASFMKKIIDLRAANRPAEVDRRKEAQ